MKFKDQNVDLFVTDALRLWEQLTATGAFNEDITLGLVDKLVNIEGENNWKYQNPVREAHVALESALQSIMHLSKSGQDCGIDQAWFEFQTSYGDSLAGVCFASV